MANHTYTFANLKTAVLQALGGNDSSTLTTAEVVNDALQWLAEQHPWTWKQKALSLNFTAAQTYVTLPTDFGSFCTLVPTSTVRMARGVTMADLLQMRVNAVATGDVGTIFYSLQFVPQASATAEPTWKMEMYPTPAANATAAIVGVYNRIIPALSSDSALPDIPAQFHQLLKYACRAHGISQQFRRDSEDWRIVMEMLPKAIASDGYGMDQGGQLIGAAARIRQDRERPFTLRGQLVP